MIPSDVSRESAADVRALLRFASPRYSLAGCGSAWGSGHDCRVPAHVLRALPAEDPVSEWEYVPTAGRIFGGTQ